MENEIHEALINIGFNKEGNYYNKNGLHIKVYPDSTLEDVFKKLIKYGSTLKVWEIKRVLEIIE